jgi:hypothetical protein
MLIRMSLATVLAICMAAAPAWSQSSTKLDDLETAEGPVEPGEATLEEDEDKEKPTAEVYGFVQTDAGYDFGRNDPDWFDVVRPSKLPSFENQFGEDGTTYFSVRQTRFGVKSWLPTGKGNIKTIFEWELFGVGDDAGQTTIRLRHAYGQWKKFGAGQYWSPFMDIDVFPNSLEYWGPSGMAFFRNIQVRYMPVMSEKNHVTIALERPGASGDRGEHNDIIEEQDLQPRYPYPDLSAEYRRMGDWGYVEAAGIVRRFEWDDLDGVPPDLSGAGTGWGLSLSTNVKLGPNGSTLKGLVLYGEGIENYMNDSTADIVVFDDPGSPGGIRAETIPVLGTVLFWDAYWNDHWTSTFGFSTISLDYDGSAATADTFTDGQYALANVQHHPTTTVMYGVEVQYGRRENFADGWTYDDYRVQFSFRYRWSFRIGGKS